MFSSTDTVLLSNEVATTPMTASRRPVTPRRSKGAVSLSTSIAAIPPAPIIGVSVRAASKAFLVNVPTESPKIPKPKRSSFKVLSTRSSTASWLFGPSTTPALPSSTRLTSPLPSPSSSSSNLLSSLRTTT